MVQSRAASTNYAYALAVATALSACSSLAYNPQSVSIPINLQDLEQISEGYYELALDGGVTLQFSGYLDSSIIDADIAALGHSTVLTSYPPTSPTTSAYGAGGIEISGGLLASLSFAYGNRGDQHFNPTFGVLGGFTGLAKSRAFGYQQYEDEADPPGPSNTSPGSIAPPAGVVANTSGGLLKQFSVGVGATAGPVTLAPKFTWETAGGATQVSELFDSFRWTNGTAFGDPDGSPTRPAKAQIAGIEAKVISHEAILTGSVTHVDDPRVMRLEFAPKVDGSPVPLSQLAKSLGVDHFNWLQQVIDVPSNYTPVVLGADAAGVYQTTNTGFNALLSAQQSLVDTANITVDPVTNQTIAKQLEGFIDVVPQTYTEPVAYGFVLSQPETHLVQPGDTLSEIADTYDVSTDYLARINGLSDPDEILAGETLTIKQHNHSWPQRLVDTKLPYLNETETNERPHYSLEQLTPIEQHGLDFFSSTYRQHQMPLGDPLTNLASTLSFEDMPLNVFLDQDDKEGSSFRFRTELVGVGANGDEILFLADLFPNAKLAWEWSSNTEMDPDEMAARFGGVFDVSAGSFPGSVDLAGLEIVGGLFGVQSVGGDLLPGDFNDDGTVNAADYTVWRDGLGGEYSDSDYLVWRDNYGATFGAGSGAPVPTPTSLALAAMACVAPWIYRRR